MRQGLAILLIGLIALSTHDTCAQRPRDSGGPQQPGFGPTRTEKDQQRFRPDGFGPGRAGGMGPSSSGPDGPPPHPLMIALDTDRDGNLSAEEISSASSALKSLDEDEDGQLSEDELLPPFGPRRRQQSSPRTNRRRVPPPRPPENDRGPQPPGRGVPSFSAGVFADHMLLFDKDNDDQVAREELPNRMRPMLDRGDENSDGALDRDELERLAADSS